MYLVRIKSLIHIIRKGERISLCGQSIPTDSMILEPFRCEATCENCNCIAMKEIIETRPVTPQIREYVRQQYGK